MSKVCKAIRHWALNQGISLAEAIKSLEISNGSFYNWERGMKPKPDVLKRIAERVGSTPAELLGDENGEVPSWNPPPRGESIAGAQYVDGGAVVAIIPASAVNDIRGVLGLCGGVIIGSVNGLLSGVSSLGDGLSGSLTAGFLQAAT